MTDPALFMTMTDIAALARVQRPVVSMWRKRTAGAAEPFPSSIATTGTRELFDAREIAEWLTATEHGNNPDAVADAAAFARPARTVLGGTDPEADETTFDAHTALLALRSTLGHSLSGLNRDDLLDAADEQDPDDDTLYREIEAIPAGDVDALTQYIDSFVEAAYSEAAAYELLVASRPRARDGALDDTTLTNDAVNLVAQIAHALAAANGVSTGAGVDTSADERFVDVTGSASDLLLRIAETASVGAEPTMLTADSTGEAARLLRRRLLVHRIPRQTLHVDSTGAFTLTAHAVHVAQLPHSAHPEMTALEMLTAIDTLALHLNDKQVAVIVAPSAVLSDAGLTPDADRLRSDVMRTGRLRAIVRLPAGLLARKPRQSLTVWVLGAAAAATPLADRWTMVADLSTAVLGPGIADDLVGDLAASLGTRAAVRAHSFRFARLVFTRTLLSSRGALVAGAQTTTPTNATAPAALAVRAEALIAALNDESGETTDAASGRLQIGIGAATPRDHTAASSVSRSTTTSTVEQLIAGKQLRYVPGNRLDPVDIVVGGPSAGGIRLIGPAEVLGKSALGTRSIDRLRFAADYAAGRVTEPGDVVFITAPRPAAIVDAEGTSVVEYPARILRIAPAASAEAAAPNDLIDAVLAADIMALPAAHQRWMRWPVRRVRPEQSDALALALAAVRSQQADARERLARLDELTELLMEGAVDGGFTITPLISEPVPPTKGTP
ncbi:hypothetical protein [Glaciibacter psychrotolerans]|uniref:DNA methylase adenine-specific domain-containing protein n=1 Tax=Glaciibacter psychrotolerans TaxID=670054 RepID=A0A7Z0EBT2_9MICO|nr:hypothetical protein [Leifsonia psychrotolerans]NYJ18714.1 hypothetical protein [Leifsonia psychrotolerans]